MDEERHQHLRNAADAVVDGVIALFTMDNHDDSNYYSQTTLSTIVVAPGTPTTMNAITTPRSKKRSRNTTNTSGFCTGSLLTTTVAVVVIATASFLCCCIQPVQAQTPTPAAFTRAAPCENNPAIIGYSTIADLNADMQDELDLINIGTSQIRPAEEPYFLSLCPGVTFDMRGPTPITPVLNNVHVVCGGNGSGSGGPNSNFNNNLPEEACILDRSGQQLLIQDIDTTIEGYRLDSFTITQVTFNDFRRGASTSITAGSAGLPATITFNNCIWQVSFTFTYL